MDLSRMFKSIYKSYNFQTANLNKKQEYGREIHGGEKTNANEWFLWTQKKEKKGKRTIHATGDQNENSKRE